MVITSLLLAIPAEKSPQKNIRTQEKGDTSPEFPRISLDVKKRYMVDYITLSSKKAPRILDPRT